MQVPIYRPFIVSTLNLGPRTEVHDEKTRTLPGRPFVFVSVAHEPVFSSSPRVSYNFPWAGQGHDSRYSFRASGLEPPPSPVPGVLSVLFVTRHGSESQRRSSFRTTALRCQPLRPVEGPGVLGPWTALGPWKWTTVHGLLY